MNKNLLKKLVKEILTEVTEAEMKKLRRVVILSIFNSIIPTEIKKDLNSAISGAPDADVRKVSRVFLDQVEKDEEDLNSSSEYQKLKQDSKFQSLSNNINQKIKANNRAGLLDLSNIAFTTADISKPFSYSMLLYYAVENEAANLLGYLNNKYGKDFQKVLYKMLPRQSRPAIKPTRENLDELSQSALINMIKSKYPAEDFDREMGTKLSKKYIYPAGYSEDVIEKTITNIMPQDPKFKDETYQQKLDDVYRRLVQMNRTYLSNIKIQSNQDKWDLIYGVISHFNPNDIKFFIETWHGDDAVNSQEGKAYFKTIEDLEKKYDVPINWMPSPNNLKIVIDALLKKFSNK